MRVVGGPLDGTELKRVAGIAFYMIAPQENRVYRYVKKDGEWKMTGVSQPIPKYFVRLDDVELGIEVKRARDAMAP